MFPYTSTIMHRTYSPACPLERFRKYFQGSPLSGIITFEEKIGSSCLPTCSAFLSAFPFSAMTSPQIQSGWCQHPRPRLLKARVGLEVLGKPHSITLHGLRMFLLTLCHNLGYPRFLDKSNCPSLHTCMNSLGHIWAETCSKTDDSDYKFGFLQVSHVLKVSTLPPKAFDTTQTSGHLQEPHAIRLPSPTGLWSSSLRLGEPHLALSAQPASRQLRPSFMAACEATSLICRSLGFMMSMTCFLHFSPW